MNETPIRIFKSKKMKSYEQIAEAMYKKWQAALARFRKPKPFAELEEHERKAWVAAAQTAHKEITEVH